MRRTFTIAALAAIALAGTAACSSGDSNSGSTSKTLTVAYQKFGAFIQMDDQMKKVKAAYEAAHP
ncbi:MAG TPA: hypothetical protein VGP91_09595, partial [Actinoplanes sp.]|nr:hypothetical protein [Actinoplanes sp.]